MVQASGPDFSHLLRRIGRELDQGEAMMQRVVASSGRALDAAQLIALQAGIYRYSEMVDLAGRFADRSANAIRTTLQSSGV
jgi:hypothetical protein